MSDEGSADSAPPELRLDEQGVELCVAVVARQNGRESEDRSVVLGDDHLARLELLERCVDDVGMREQCLPIARIRQGRAPLQFDQSRSLRRNSGADDHRE